MAYDVVIVGGGSAGCVLASRLSEDPARTVLLLEAGRAYPPDGYPADLTGSAIAVEPAHTWGYLSVPPGPAHAVAAYAGRVLGGGSAINAGIARRARPSDFARWERHGLTEWSFAHALDTYRALERTGDGDDRWHGRSGPWPVHQTTHDELTPPVRAYLDAAIALGYDRVTDFNADRQEGVGAEVKNIVGGVRYNAGMAYLTAAVRARPNLTIRPDTTVDRVATDAAGVVRPRATTVHLVGGEAVAAQEVVVAAGVYATPALLLRSGIGPAAHLRAYGIDVVADLPVGERLRDQPMYALTYRVRSDAGATPPDGSCVLWTRSSEADADALDLQHLASVQPDTDEAGLRARTLRIWAAVVLPRSTGTVRLRGTDPTVTPRITYNLLADPSDRRRLREAVRLARRVAEAAPVAAVLERELLPGPAVRTDAELDAALDAGLITFYHGTSTAPMGGPDDPAAVCDGEGRVRGVAALRVVDASLFPEAVSVPTNLTVLMVAERIAAAMRSAPVSR